MKGKPLFPYAGVAIVGLVLMVVLAFVGVNQKEDLLASEGETEVGQPAENNVDPSSPTAAGEELYKATCIGCHGGNFDGPMGNLNGVGDRRSKEEIMTIINQGGADFGLPGMPAFKDIDNEAIAEYLLEATK